MRRLLNGLYAATAYLAAFAMIAIAALILIQVVLRFFGTQLKSADDFAGFALVATIMLGLAPTYRHNAHIRVGLLIERLAVGTPLRNAIELAVVLVSVLIVGWAAWGSMLFVYESFIYNEMSQGLLAIPMWIPQSFMALGVITFLIALLDDLVVHLQGGVQSHLAVGATGDEMPVEK